MLSLVGTLDKVTKYQYFFGLLGFYLFIDVLLCYFDQGGVLTASISWSQINPLNLMAIILLYSAFSLWLFPLLKTFIYTVYYHVRKIDIQKKNTDGIFIHHAVDYALCNNDQMVLDICNDNRIKKEEVYREGNLALSIIIWVVIDTVFSEGVTRSYIRFFTEGNLSGLAQVVHILIAITLLILGGALVKIAFGEHTRQYNYILDSSHHKVKIQEIEKWITTERK